MNKHNDNYPEQPAIEGKAEKLMVFLHGLGSDGHDLISLVPFMHKALPEYHFISPHGMEEYDMAPFGYQWFSLSDRQKDRIVELTSQNTPILQKIIRDKQQELSLTNADTVIFGFSQGTMMGVYLTLIQEEPFLATIGFSGRLIEPAEVSNSKTPICLIHGQDDDVVPAEESSIMENYLKKHNIKCQKLLIPHLTHSIDGKGMEFAINFLKNIK